MLSYKMFNELGYVGKVRHWTEVLKNLNVQTSLFEQRHNQGIWTGSKELTHSLKRGVGIMSCVQDFLLVDIVIFQS